MRSSWRMIWITALASCACAASALVIVRTAGLAQGEAPAESPAEPPVEAEEDTVGAPVAPREEVSPELRESADNNISFPVDI